jgi:hypothetical protein
VFLHVDQKSSAVIALATSGAINEAFISGTQHGGLNR